MMKAPLNQFVARVIAGLLFLSFAGFSAANEDSVLTSVFSKTDKGYRRQKDADGRFVREYYAMSNGGPAAGTIQDNTQDKVKFASLASVLAEHLARQGYFPATDPNKVDLLVVVNWGRTTPFNDNTYQSGSANVLAAMNSVATFPPPTVQVVSANDQGSAPQAEVSLTGSVQDMQRQAAQDSLTGAMLTQELFNRARNEDNAKNARLLGYIGDINESDGVQRFAGGGNKYSDLVADIEEARYYMIVSAYDFKKTVREKKPKLQWVTRMSMRVPGNSFSDKVASLIAYGASRFGQNTSGLERKESPNYQVKLDDIKFLGEAEKLPTPTPSGVEQKK